jgi:prophage regulatory protein
MPQQPSPCALRPAVAAQKLGIGLSTLRGKAKNESGFPRPVKTGPRVTIFLEHDLDAWLASRAAARNA